MGLPAKKQLEQAYREASEGGRWFSVEFVKKNGERRKMICREGVYRHLKGGELKYEPQKYDLKTVWDAGKGDYRMVPTDPARVISVRGRGRVLFQNEELQVFYDGQEEDSP
jgi:hypothetical protein